VVAISVLITLGNQVKGVFTTITSQLAVASSSH
jgi:Flp pilus assembly pilin Flp